VDVSELCVVPGGRSARSSILVEARSATRAIATFPGVAGRVRADGRARALCAGAAWVHADHVGYRAARELVPPRLSVDAGNSIDDFGLDSVTLYAPTDAALARAYPGVAARAAMEQALAAGAELVVVTRGALGSMAATRDGAFVEADGFPVDARSTLGAGDVFHGALLAGLVRGSSLAEALTRANAAAALSCRGLDGRSAIPTAAELEEAL
jgi:sugar/nucleoside kinase (ribokinase family)